MLDFESHLTKAFEDVVALLEEMGLESFAICSNSFGVEEWECCSLENVRGLEMAGESKFSVYPDSIVRYHGRVKKERQKGKRERKKKRELTPPSIKPPDCPTAEIKVSGPMTQHTRQPGSRKPFVKPPIKITLSSLTSSMYSAAET